MPPLSCPELDEVHITAASFASSQNEG